MKADEREIRRKRRIQGDGGSSERAAGGGSQDVAESLYIHPFMLSRWRKQVREGRIVAKGIQIDQDTAAELKALRRMKRDYERLKVEHALLKKAIEFTSQQKVRSSRSSSTTKKGSR